MDSIAATPSRVGVVFGKLGFVVDEGQDDDNFVENSQRLSD